MEEEDQTEAIFQFLVQGVGITLIATFGIIGNILSAIVITRPKLKSSITWLLIGLTFFDLIFLILNILIYSLIAIFTYLEIGNEYINIMDPVQSPILVTINDTAQTASVYFTVFIALERFIIVRWPLASRPYCTYEKCRITSVFVFLFACVYQGFRLLFPQTPIHRHTKVELNLNCPGLNLDLNDTTPGADADYEEYFFRWPYMTFIMILPSVVLIFLNASIYTTVAEATRKRMKMSISKKSEEKERSITTMLLVVVLVFLICQIDFYIMAIIHKSNECVWKASNVYLISIDLFLITLNSSVNFLIYCTFGSNFRNEFKRLFCIKYFAQKISDDGGNITSITSTEGNGKPSYQMKKTGASIRY